MNTALNSELVVSKFNIKDKLLITNDFKNIFKYDFAENTLSDEYTNCLMPIYDRDLKKDIYLSLYTNPKKFINNFSTKTLQDNRDILEFYRIVYFNLLNKEFTDLKKIDSNYGLDLMDCWIDNYVNNHNVIIDGQQRTALIYSVKNKRVEYLDTKNIEKEQLNKTNIALNLSDSEYYFDLVTLENLYGKVYIDSQEQVYSHYFTLNVDNSNTYFFRNKKQTILKNNNFNKKYNNIDSMICNSDYKLNLDSKTYGLISLRNVDIQSISNTLKEFNLFSCYYLVKILDDKQYVCDLDCKKMYNNLKQKFDMNNIKTPNEFSTVFNINLELDELPF